MDPIWLRTMWEDGKTAHVDMIEILISLALLKLKSSLWSVDPFEKQWCYVIYGLYPLLDDGLRLWWPIPLMFIYVMMILLYFLWCILWYVSITIFYSHSLSKVFCCNFLVTKRKVEIPESCSARDRAGRWVMGSVTS